MSHDRVHAHGIAPPWSRRAAAATVLALAVACLAGCTSSETRTPDSASGTALPTTASGTAPTGGTSLIPPDGGAGETPPPRTGSTPSDSDGPPDAALLPWLAGPQTEDGVVLTTDAGKRWQGPQPGEFALISDTGYSWFGPDGSMVGCVTGSGCIGVDSVGNIAVTGPDAAARDVYDPGGGFRGRYSTDGKQLPERKNPPTLAKAIADTGVDLPGLVNAATLAAPFAGGVTGDPHLITAGGMRYTTQATGQFIAREGDPAHTIQLQFNTMAHRDDVSVVSAVAVHSGGDTIVIGLDANVRVDGYSRLFRTSFEQQTLDSGVVIGRWPTADDGTRTIALVWPDGGSIIVDVHPALGLTVVAHLHHVADAAGLFGTSRTAKDGPNLSDLRAGDGTARSTRLVVESWRVREAQRLFSDPPVEVSATPSTTPSIDPGATKVADAACSGHGFTRTDDISACAFDVGLTGDTGFVQGHQLLASAAENPLVASNFADRWPALTTDGVGNPVALPAGGSIDTTLGAHSSRVFTVTVAHAGEVTFVNRNGCGVGETPPGLDQPAMRLFDLSGHAVSDRFALCGHEQSQRLVPGTYHLVIAGGPDSDELPVRVDVSVP